MLTQGHTTLSARIHAEFFHPWLFGIHGDRLIPKYQPGWPAVIAVAHFLGNEQVALVIAAAGVTVATWFLAQEVEPGSAIFAVGVLLISPIFIVHSGLYLSYLFTTALVTGGCAAVLAGLRTRRRWAYGLAGGLFGVAQLTRPADALIVGVVTVAYLAFILRRDLQSLRTAVTWIGLGLLPFLVVNGIYNAHITGSPVRFPFQAAEPLDSFGFGRHRLLPETLELDYTRAIAVRALTDNLSAVPRWIAGGGIGVVLAASAVVLYRRRPVTWLLFTVVIAFPLVYTFWWGTALEALGSRIGLGPYYYVPAFAPLAVLAGCTLHQLAQRSRRIVALVIVALIAGSVTVTPTIWDDKHRVTEASRAKRDAVTETGLHNAVVIMRADRQPYSFYTHPFLVGDPELTDDVLYANDGGPRSYALADQFPSRGLYQWVERAKPGSQQLVSLLEPLKLKTGRTVTLDFDLSDPDGRHVVVAYLKVNGLLVATRTLTHTLQRGRVVHLTVVLAATGTKPPASRGRVLATPVGQDGDIIVGAAYGSDANLDKADIYERRYFIAYRPGHPNQLSLQTPGLHFHLDRLDHTVANPEDVGTHLVEHP